MHIGAAGAQPGIAKEQRVHLVQILLPVRDNASNASFLRNCLKQ